MIDETTDYAHEWEQMSTTEIRGLDALRASTRAECERQTRRSDVRRVVGFSLVGLAVLLLLV